MIETKKKEALKFLHEIWTDAAYKRFKIKGKEYDHNMKRKFALIQEAIHRWHYHEPPVTL